MRRLALLVTLAALAAPHAAHGQAGLEPTFGRITGRIISSTTGVGIVGAGVQVVGVDSMTVKTGIDGRYNFPRVPTGPVTLHVRSLGYNPKTVTDMYLRAGDALEQDVTLDLATLQAVTVSAPKEKGTVSEALDAQRTAIGVTNSVTAEAIARSPDANAAQAVQRASGINIGDDNTVTARGLQDKYTTTSLNDARIPSPDPEKRVVPLDMFPSGLLQSITVSKTFSPDLQGDFAGALVNIKTKEFPARRMWAAQLGRGYASGATGSRLIAGQTAGGEGLAMASANRQLPALLKYVGNFEGLTLGQEDQNRLVSQFRNAWTPRTVSALPNASGSISFGGNDPILLGHRLGYLLSGTYSSGTDLKDNQVRALAARGTSGEAVEQDRFEGKTASQNVLWGGLLNASTLIGSSSQITLNGIYNRTADNDARVERGFFENEGLPVQITRMQYAERSVHSIQLSGDHERGNNGVNWAITSSGVRRDEPDRSEFIQVITPATPSTPESLLWMTNNGAIRTFSSLDERSTEGRGSYLRVFGDPGHRSAVKIGGLVRHTDRTADTREYSIYSTHATAEMRMLPAEQLFDGRFTNPGDSVFGIAPLSQGGSYGATDRLSAGFAMTEFPIGSRTRVTAGARYENDHVVVNAKSTLGTPVTITKDWSDVLPSVTVNIQLTDKQQLRVAASRTLARPEYRELTPIATREVLNGELLVGSDKLQRARILNGDVRWESYYNPGDVLSVALFVKDFTDPIERIYRAETQGHKVGFTNAEGAHNYGMEVEWRGRLAPIAPALAPFTAFGNVTLMHSEITLSPDAEASATNLSRRMVGQAPYVVNAGVTYGAGNGATATLLYNVVGERIEAAGESPLPDVIREARHGLDLSVRFPIVGTWSGRLDAKNLLDDPFRVTQGRVVREEYRIGRVIQAGVMWKP